MSNVYDGGPAFPVLNRSKECSNWDGETHVAHETVGGMSLRAYFMAHAPAEPQAWFSPAGVAELPPMPAMVQNMTEAEATEMEGWGEYLGTSDLTELRVIEFALAHDARSKEVSLLALEFEKQRYLQWPAAWADEQLAILKGKP